MVCCVLGKKITFRKSQSIFLLFCKSVLNFRKIPLQTIPSRALTPSLTPSRHSGTIQWVLRYFPCFTFSLAWSYFWRVFSVRKKVAIFLKWTWPTHSSTFPSVPLKSEIKDRVIWNDIEMEKVLQCTSWRDISFPTQLFKKSRPHPFVFRGCSSTADKIWFVQRWRSVLLAWCNYSLLLLVFQLLWCWGAVLGWQKVQLLYWPDWRPRMSSKSWFWGSFW